MTACRTIVLYFVSNWRNLDEWEDNEKLENGSNGLSFFQKIKKWQKYSNDNIAKLKKKKSGETQKILSW